MSDKLIPTESGWYWALINYNPTVVVLTFRQPHVYDKPFKEVQISIGGLLIEAGYMDKETGKRLNYDGSDASENTQIEFISRIDDADVPMTVGVVEDSK